MSLTKEQVYALNEKYGWFEFGDAQGDVSVAFANDAIAMHERLRADAPALLDALKMFTENSSVQLNYPDYCKYAEALIAKHRGES